MLVAEDTEIGYKVIINNTHWGLVYHNEVFQRLEKVGMSTVIVVT